LAIVVTFAGLGRADLAARMKQFDVQPFERLAAILAN
jgi:hypothetical protein